MSSESDRPEDPMQAPKTLDPTPIRGTRGRFSGFQEIDGPEGPVTVPVTRRAGINEQDLRILLDGRASRFDAIYGFFLNSFVAAVGGALGVLASRDDLWTHTTDNQLALLRPGAMLIVFVTLAFVFGCAAMFFRGKRKTDTGPTAYTRLLDRLQKELQLGPNWNR